MTILLGPSDADHFRVQVGRYGDRWYHDPIPACPLADACDDTWPSVSSVKKASGSDWSFVAIRRIAQALHQRPRIFDDCDYDELYERLKGINQRGLKQASSRGTNVHLYMERGLRGEKIEATIPGEDGEEYLPAVRAFFDQYQPELIAAEVVAINRSLNGMGYGGTGDALIRIEGQTLWPDWKSRGEDSKHGAYPEEAAQVGAYAMADYLIVEGDTGPVRMAVPKLDGGLIVSIKPDGCRIYPVDLAKAAEHWAALHGWWVARRTEREPLGKPWAPRKSRTNGETLSDTSQIIRPPDTSSITSTMSTTSATPTTSTTVSTTSSSPPSTTAAPTTSVVSSAPTPGAPVLPTAPTPPANTATDPPTWSTSPATSAACSKTRRAQILTRLTAFDELARARVRTAWPEGVPGLRADHEHSDAELDLIEQAMGGEAAFGPAPDQVEAVVPDEGPLVPPEDVAALKKLASEATPEAQAWMKAVGKQCAAAGYSINLAHGATRRRWAIGAAMLHVAKADTAEHIVRALLEEVGGFAEGPLGVAFAGLTIEQAERLAQLADSLRRDDERRAA